MIAPKLHVDLQWLNRVSLNLPLFRKIKKDTFNSRCIVCGDSQKSERKTRLYFYVRKGQLNVSCKNCGYSHSFYRFMKDMFPAQFDEYKKETLFDALRGSRNDVSSSHAPTHVPRQGTLPEMQTDAFLTIQELSEYAVPMLSLEKEHPARAYMEGRAFSERELARLYYAGDFQKLAARINPEAAQNMKSEGRIVIPFINPKGEIEMVQGRSLDPRSKLKYLSIKANDDVTKVYGLYELDESKTVYCTEGPLDSLFVDNCVATCDGNLTRFQADVYIWDNQPRNKDVVRYMEEAIEEGKNVVIWPHTNGSKMDINDMIRMGLTQKQLMAVIRKSTFSGLMAKAKLLQWKRV